MKNKKGFTLTELLIVIVILVSITMGSIVGIDTIQKEIEEKQLDEMITEIEEAADVYINLNDVYVDQILNDNERICTKVYILQTEGLIKNDLINPVTNERIPANLCVYSYNNNGVIKSSFEIE